MYVSVKFKLGQKITSGDQDIGHHQWPIRESPCIYKHLSSFIIFMWCSNFFFNYGMPFLFSIPELQMNKLHIKPTEREGCYFCSAQSHGVNSIEAKFSLSPKNKNIGFIKWKWEENWEWKSSVYCIRTGSAMAGVIMQGRPRVRLQLNGKRVSTVNKGHPRRERQQQWGVKQKEH